MLGKLNFLPLQRTGIFASNMLMFLPDKIDSDTNLFANCTIDLYEKMQCFIKITIRLFLQKEPKLNPENKCCFAPNGARYQVRPFVIWEKMISNVAILCILLHQMAQSPIQTKS